MRRRVGLAEKDAAAMLGLHKPPLTADVLGHPALKSGNCSLKPKVVGPKLSW
jgi:hypothetical protein